MKLLSFSQMCCTEYLTRYFVISCRSTSVVWWNLVEVYFNPTECTFVKLKWSWILIHVDLYIDERVDFPLFDARDKHNNSSYVYYRGRGIGSYALEWKHVPYVTVLTWAPLLPVLTRKIQKTLSKRTQTYCSYW